MISNHPCVRGGLLAALVFILASCKEEQEQIKRLEVEIRTLSDQQALGQSELTRLKTQIDSLNKEKSGMKQEKEKLEGELEEERKRLDQLQKDFDAYRNEYKVSMRTRGLEMKLGDLVVGGRKYLNVIVKKVTDELLSVRHEAGLEKFAWSELPDEVRKLFGIEEPGEYVSYARGGSGREPPATKEEQIRRHDEQMRDTEAELSKDTSDLTRLRSLRSETYTMLGQARAKGLDTSKLAKALADIDVKIIRIEAEIERLRRLQKDLLEKNPRKKRD